MNDEREELEGTYFVCGLWIKTGAIIVLKKGVENKFGGLQPESVGLVSVQEFSAILVFFPSSVVGI